ncbi:hypothetical protein [Microcoleus sp. bin38.metabat.b11b12b14.051]|uniref:hypothetical protein n=1 Tax=Microcoleus sp. bin38.metabat.b11b12b14.051 TaxID=2742709 RepID=UPI0025D2700E|nr:hypothetical protein [Microcoleus sp. bin38.metabat.b11b12b14.051]
MAIKRQRTKRPRLTDKKGKMLSPEQAGKNIDNWVEGEFEEELRMTAFLDVNTRRQIRLATGVGDMKSFVEEFNKGFSNTSQLSIEDKPRAGEEAFGEAWQNRPKLRKISQEYRINYRKGGTPGGGTQTT